VGGTPEAFLLDHQSRVVREFPSTQLPLGIVGNGDIDHSPMEFAWEGESQLMLCSDGLLEAEDRENRPFGKDGLLAAIADTPAVGRFDAIEAALLGHLGEALATDDVSIMLIDCP